jgi:hypothetical protein
MASWVESHLDNAKPSANGEWTAECPSCGRFGGFYVNCDPDHERAGNFVCFKCDWKSKSFPALIAKVEDIDYADARKIILKESVSFRRRETIETLKDRIKSMRATEELDWESAWGSTEIAAELPREFVPVWDGKRWRVPEYMSMRGFYRETLRDWGVGFCDRGYFGGRIIIPFECPNGKSFTARDLTGEQEPKYLNPKGVDHARLLYGWPFVPTNSDFALVEGPLDAMKFNQHGISALGTGGKVLSTEQLNMLFSRPAHVRVVVMYDPEEHTAPFGAAEQLITRFRNLYIGKLPLGTDPGSSTRKQARRAMDRAEPFDGNRNGKVKGAIASAREKLGRRFG